MVEAGHPVPDAAGVRASERIAALVRNLHADDLVLGLFSGGGSALLALPPTGLTLEDLQAGQSCIAGERREHPEMNCVRKHLSQLQGGRLAARCAPARVYTLLISDVPGDDPAAIASGPTVADPSTCADALRILDRYGIDSRSGCALPGSGPTETIKPGDPRLARWHLRIIASSRLALEAAAQRARARGVAALILSDRIEGEAREVGRRTARSRGKSCTWTTGAPPCVLLSGGETTVTVRHAGRGGRNAEFLLGAMLALEGLPGVYALAADTDGIDGTEENAGARCGPDSLARAPVLGLEPRVS